MALILFGDETQLTPANFSAEGAGQTNEIRRRGDISIVKRKKEEHFDAFIMLNEQGRMHPTLSQFPNEKFYDGMLTDAPHTDRSLDEAVPGLPAALDEILAQLDTKFPASDRTRHVQYFTVKGTRRENMQTKSKVRIEHPSFFIKKIWAHLHAVLGVKLESEVYVLVAYKESYR